MSGRQPTKHTTYYELLDAVRNAAGCPLCDIEASSVKRYFESLLHESVNDPGVREALTRSRGYCHRHAHYLRSHGNGLESRSCTRIRSSFFYGHWIASRQSRRRSRGRGPAPGNGPKAARHVVRRTTAAAVMAAPCSSGFTIRKCAALLMPAVDSAFRTFWRCWICRWTRKRGPF